MKIKLKIKKQPKITDLESIGVGINKSSKKYILGIDPSLTHTGLIVLSLDGFGVVHKSTLIPKTKGVKRLIDLGVCLEQIIWEYKPIVAVMEGYGYSPRQGNLMGLGELGGIYKTLLYNNHIPTYIVAPMSLKKFATGSGKGDKNLIMLKVYRKYGVELKDDNQTDAYVLAQVGVRIDQFKNKALPRDIPKYESEVLTTVLKNEMT